MKNIIICADDYGQNPSISQAIIALAAGKRISAISCLTTSAYWPIAAKKLRPYQGKVDIGLHFNLCLGRPLTIKRRKKLFTPISQLIIKAYLKRLNINAIILELNAQIDLFYELMGFLPDFIDGHQHIQQLPIVRDAILQVYATRMPPTTYVRCLYDAQPITFRPWATYIKRLIIQFCGARTLKNLLLKAGVPHNTSFVGFSNFSAQTDYRALYKNFFQKLQNGGLLMCHPGGHSRSLSDSIAKARYAETCFLQSDNFLQLCEDEQVNICRYSQTI